MNISRTIEKVIRNLAGKYPIIGLTGPRQSGKTTLLKTLFSDYRYVSLENPDNRNFAETDPNGFFELYNDKVIIDEAQRAPKIFSYLQTIVDDSGKMGQFILSGSQNFHLMQNITQTLAGRVAIFKLLPFDNQELNSANLLNDDYLPLLIKGFYPAIYDRDIPSKVFYSNYLQTYIQRDITELIAIKELRLFQNFLGLCAAQVGQLLNLNSLATACGISQPTAKSWLSALENSYIVFQLFPYHRNYSKRIVKTPKLYFYDTGLVCFLLKLHKIEQLATNPIKGHLFENMMIAEYVKRMFHSNNLTDIWFWRDASGHEVDMIIEDGLQLNVVEFKASQTIMPDMFNGLTWFEKTAVNQRLKKTLVYGGAQFQERSSGTVLPWKEFAKEI